MSYVPIGVSDEVGRRLQALDKREIRWPALHLLIAVAATAITYKTVTRTSTK